MPSWCQAPTRSRARSWTPHIPALSLPPEDAARPLLFEALGQGADQAGETEVLLLAGAREGTSRVWG